MLFYVHWFYFSFRSWISHFSIRFPLFFVDLDFFLLELPDIILCESCFVIEGLSEHMPLLISPRSRRRYSSPRPPRVSGEIERDKAMEDPALDCDAFELKIAAEFLRKWLPFLGRDFCRHCRRTLTDGIRSLHPGRSHSSSIPLPFSWFDFFLLNLHFLSLKELGYI